MGWFLLIGALAVTFVVYCCLIVGSDSFQDRRNRLADGAEPKNIETRPRPGTGFPYLRLTLLPRGRGFPAARCNAQRYHGKPETRKQHQVEQLEQQRFPGQYSGARRGGNLPQ